MSTQIAVRLPEEIVEFVDEQVSTGAARSRAEFIWHALRREQRRMAAERDAAGLSRILCKGGGGSLEG
jgi:Arc/MetJ-type ribon-helix-helix transcriptional regulator